MVQALFAGLQNFLLGMCKFIGYLTFHPIQILVTSLFPSIDSTTVLYVTDFFSSRVFPVISWLKGLFLSITGFPNVLFSILVLQLLAFFAAAVSIRIIMFIVRLYYLIRGANV